MRYRFATPLYIKAKDLVGFMFHNHAYTTQIRTRLLRGHHIGALLAGVDALQGFEPYSK